MSEPPSAPQGPRTPHQASGSEVRVQVPASLQERTAAFIALTRAIEDAYLAKDRDLYDLCALRQDQFLLACRIEDVERGTDPQPGLLPSLRSTLAVVNSKLQRAQQQQQQQQQPAPPAGQGGGH